MPIGISCLEGGHMFRRSNYLVWFVAGLLLAVLTGCSTPEERAQAHYQSGKTLLAENDHIKAAIEFRNAIKYNDKLTDAWFGLAQAEEKRQNWPVVADSLTRVTELDPKHFEAVFKLAKLQLTAIQLEPALKNVNKADELKKDNTDVFALRAAILFRLNDREGAVRDAEKALALNPDNPDAHAVLAADAMQRGKSAEALTFVDRGLKADQKNLGLLLFKIKIFETEKDAGKLEAVLREVISYYPEQKEFRQALMSYLFSLNRKEEVETEMRSIVEGDPDDTTAGLDLVRLVSTIRGPAAGRGELEKLVSTRPEKVIYKLALARLDFNEKKKKEAFDALNAVIAKNANTDDVRQSRLLLAELQRLEGKTDDAAASIKAVLDEDPKNSDGLAIRATMRLEAGDNDGAVGDLREALGQQPQSVQLMTLLARAYERQGSAELAINQFGEALKTAKYDPEVALQYIDLLRRRGKYDTIDLVLNEAVTRNPSNIKLLTTLGELRLNRQDWAGAEEVAGTLARISPDSGIAKQIRAAAQLGQKKYVESIETLKESFSASPKSSRVMSSLAIAYLQSGQVTEAENFLNSVLKANPKNVEAMSMLGGVRVMQKKPDEAADAFRKVIETDPKFPGGYFSLAKLLVSQNKNNEAVEVLAQGRKAGATDLGSSLLLASLLESRGDVEGSISVYEDQLKKTPDVLIIVNNLASLLADHRTDDQSLQQASNLAKRLEAVDVPQFKDTVGWVAYRKGEFRKAVSNLVAAVEKLPDMGIIRYHLGMTYLALEQREEAKKELAKADELLPENDALDAKVKEAIGKANEVKTP
jgi:cellulose synthase operon protein C